LFTQSSLHSHKIPTRYTIVLTRCDKIIISAQLAKNSSVEITILSLVGVIIDSRLIPETQFVNEEFGIRILSPGVYLVKLKSDEGVMVEKFIKL
jgi:hypothetical protein